MKIALDVMGGDHAPTANINGAKLAIQSLPEIQRLFLVGDEDTLKSSSDDQLLHSEKIEIVHASEVVGMNESPAKAIRRKKNSSISIATDLVKDGTCEALVSAGNTGAAVAAATIKLRNLPGVERAGIVSAIPNEYGQCNIVDAGANPEAKATHLLQYAIMGSVYSQHVLGKKSPRVGLMSVGTEEEKGTEFTREVFTMLKESDINFIGNVEGHDLFESEIDVVVCDGFTGNVMLKSCEATASAMSKWIKQEILKSPLRQLGAMLVKPALKAVNARASYEEYGGSPLLGINGTCIIAHGGSSSLAIKNALRVAVETVSHRVNPHIEKEIAKLCIPQSTHA
ncbi:MAG: phosphate acyltransferase PlsX [Verrucomicrobiaceae bacterium]|nr:phosphate acyltransferase PlsX [Verrucomicrobiaceae bacterium]